MAIYTDYVAAALMYNLQILPESLMTGILILAIVLANQALLAMAAGAAGTQLLTGAIGRIIMRMSSNAAVPTSSMDMCTTGFIGKSWDRLFRASPDQFWHPRAPSVYMATIGFFIGYGLALQNLYKEEIDAKVMSRASLMTTAVISCLLLITAFVFRISSGCETILGAVGGAALGLMIGYLGCIALGYATDRRATNLWGIPLLRDRINNGSALYICPKEEET
jgi:hypothetical protein